MYLLLLWTFSPLDFLLSMKKANLVLIQVNIDLFFKDQNKQNLSVKLFVTAKESPLAFSAPSDDDDEVVAMIKELLDSRIR